MSLIKRTAGKFDPTAAFKDAENLFAAQKFSESKDLCQNILKENPECCDALRLIGMIFAQENKIPSAIKNLTKACEIDPDNSLYKRTLARLYMRSGYSGKAILMIMDAIILDPKDAQSKMFFLHWVKGRNVEIVSETLKKVLLLCLQDQNLTRKFLIVPWLAIISNGDGYETLRKISGCTSYEDFISDIDDDNLKKMLDEPLFLAGLPILCVANPLLEKALTFLRRYFAERVFLSFDNDCFNFVAVLGLNCFLSEYVFSQSPDEMDIVKKLQNKIEECDPSAPDSHNMIAVYSCYEPLTELANAQAIFDAAQNSDSIYFEELVRQQIEKPQKEMELKKDIPVLTKISDEISISVRDQYEENPYPRWHSWKKSSNHNSGVMRGKGKVVLNAGCGTGQSPISTAIAHPNVDVMAVDLSLASLAYAKRQAQEMELDNVSFAQADILELESLGQNFDMITSGGVLHHMKDPLEGWRVLTALLKPDAVLQLGLYSERGRAAQMSGQEWIKAQEIPATAEGIRGFRDHVFECDDCSSMKELAGMYDFYSLSNCRDLVFHVMEHRFSCLDLSAMMEDLGLKFLGFDNLTPQIRTQYKAMFPNDFEMLDLENWDKFEQENPLTFAAMYKFWCCRKDERPANDLPDWFKVKP